MKKFVAIGLTMAFLAVGTRAENGGTTTAPFLTMPGEAKGAALGEAYSADATGSHAVWYNPAGLARKSVPTLSLMHTLYLEGMAYSTLSAAVPFGQGHAVGLGVGYLSDGSIPSYDASAQSAPAYSPKDLSLRLAYAKTFSSLSLGVEIFHIKSTIQDSASTNAFNLGAQQTLGPVSLGLAMENIGHSLTFQNEPSPLPRQLRLGVGCRVLSSWNVSSDIVRPAIGPLWEAVGTEYLYKISDDKSVALRAGYNNRVTDDLSGLSGVSAGSGFQIGSLMFNYAWIPFGILGQTHRFSLDFQLGGRDWAVERDDSLWARVSQPSPIRANEKSAGQNFSAWPTRPWKVTTSISRSSKENVMSLLARDALCPASGSKAVFARIKGGVVIKKVDQLRWTRARVGQYLFEGDTLRTMPLSQTDLVLLNGARIQVAEQAQLQIKGEPSCELARVRLENGRLHGEVRGDRGLTVETSVGEIHWQDVHGSASMNAGELALRVTAGSATFTSDGNQVVLEPGKIYRKTQNQPELVAENDPNPAELEQPFSSVVASTVSEREISSQEIADRAIADQKIAGRWDPAYVRQFESEIKRLDQIPDVALSEYVRDAGLRAELQQNVNDLKQRKDDLAARSVEFKQDVDGFKQLTDTLRVRVPQETKEERKLRLQQFKETRAALRQATRSMKTMDKDLRVTLKEFRFNEEYLAAVPIVRMLNITAQESVIPFDTSDASVSEDAAATLDKIADSIKALNPYRVVVEGHTDKSGSSWANRRLSKKRADTVAAYLQKKTGLAPHRFLAKGMGSGHPLDENASPELMGKNRRVEIWLELRGL